MRKYYLILSVLLFFSTKNTVIAQIENEIKAFTDSTELLVINGRKMIWQHIQSYDNDKVAEIYNYLNEITRSKNCCAFTYNEDLFITSLINDWNEFLNCAANYSDNTRQPLCYQIRDYISGFLHKEVSEHAGRLLEIARKDEKLTAEDKDLLDAYFYILGNGQDEIFDKKIKDFKKKYSKSRYNDFVNNYLPAPKLRGGMNIVFGATQIFPTGNLKTYFMPATIFNTSFEFYLNRMFYDFLLEGGSIKLRTSLLTETTCYDVDFSYKEKFRYFNAGLIVGYSIVQNKRMLFSPFMFIGGTTLESNLYHSNDDELEFEIFNSFIIGPGLRTEVKIISFKHKTMSSFLNLRVDAGYNFPVKYNFTQAKGNIFYTRCSLVWYMGDI